MDRLAYTALNSLANLRDDRIVSAQNLANMSVPGFRRDLPNNGAARFLEMLGAQTSRAFQLEHGVHGFSRTPGPLEQTGDQMDIAIADRGFFLIAPATGGDMALSRRGDLQVGVDGSLRNGAGDLMLSTEMQPIILPPFRELVVDDLGQVLIAPLDGAPGALVGVAMLGTVDPADDLALRKSEDGHIRRLDGEALPPPDQQARVVQGMREGSNVNATAELIASIELQRRFELNLRMVQTAREIDEAGAALLRPPSG
ncbi:MAG: flagellar biosynthesis protein FlgF [Roseinatronobacter sp.]|jgi:flagellar basal-body rod protein FlgF|nr:flagellar biosynthesis protein FlgF [Roseinatronobacter sp.]